MALPPLPRDLALKPVEVEPARLVLSAPASVVSSDDVSPSCDVSILDSSRSPSPVAPVSSDISEP